MNNNKTPTHAATEKHHRVWKSTIESLSRSQTKQTRCLDAYSVSFRGSALYNLCKTTTSKCIEILDSHKAQTTSENSTCTQKLQTLGFIADTVRRSMGILHSPSTHPLSRTGPARFQTRPGATMEAGTSLTPNPCVGWGEHVDVVPDRWKRGEALAGDEIRLDVCYIYGVRELCNLCYFME